MADIVPCQLKGLLKHRRGRDKELNMCHHTPALEGSEVKGFCLTAMVSECCRRSQIVETFLPEEFQSRPTHTSVKRHSLYEIQSLFLYQPQENTWMKPLTVLVSTRKLEFVVAQAMPKSLDDVLARLLRRGRLFGYRVTRYSVCFW